jgi:hypothetical protein
VQQRGDFDANGYTVQYETLPDEEGVKLSSVYRHFHLPHRWGPCDEAM